MTLELIRRFKWNCRLLMKRADTSIASPLENSFIILCGEDRNVIYLEFEAFSFFHQLASILIDRYSFAYRVNFSFPSSFFFFSSSLFLCYIYDREKETFKNQAKIHLLSDFLIKNKIDIDNSRIKQWNENKPSSYDFYPSVPSLDPPFFPSLARISQLSPQRSTNIEYEEEDKDPRVARRCHGVIEFSNLLLQILSNFSPFPSLFLSLSFQICPCESGGRPAPVTFLMTTAPIGATRDKSRVMRAEVNHGPL